MSGPRFLNEWPEDTAIAWWNEGRARLNTLIRAHNALQKEAALGADAAGAAKRLLLDLEEARQTWAARDGGGGWRDELDGMTAAVEAVLGLQATQTQTD